MSVQAGTLPAHHAAPLANRRVTQQQRKRLALALLKLTFASGDAMTHSEARAIVNDRVRRGETPSQIEAYLRSTFRGDPTGTTAVRNVYRERGY